MGKKLVYVYYKMTSIPHIKASVWDKKWLANKIQPFLLPQLYYNVCCFAPFKFFYVHRETCITKPVATLKCLPMSKQS